MPRVINGIHWSNKNHPPADEQIRCALPNGVLTILHHNIFEPIGNGQTVYQYIRSVGPEILIIVRMYHPNWTTLDADGWAAHSIESLRDLWADPYVSVTPANEQNLHYECGDNDPANQWKYTTREHYDTIGRFAIDWANGINRRVPNRRATLCWPALAQGHDMIPGIPDSEYTNVTIRRAMMYFYELLSSHPYGHLDYPNGHETVGPNGRERFWHMERDFRPRGYKNAADPGGTLAQFAGKKFALNETNTFRAIQQAETVRALESLYTRSAAHPQVIGITPYIADSGPEHNDNLIWPHLTLRQWVMDGPRYTTNVRVPVAFERNRTVDFKTALHEKLDALHKDKGVRLNERAAMQKAATPVGYVPTTNEDTLTDASGTVYAIQRYQHTVTGDVRDYYTHGPDWTGNIRFFEYPKAG